jgi:hypothetical protein
MTTQTTNKKPATGDPDSSGAASPVDAPAAPAPTQAPAPPGTAAPPMNELFELKPDALDATPAQIAATDERLRNIVNRQVHWLLRRDPVVEEHNVLFLFDSTSISRFTANRIYTGISSFDFNKPLLLVVNSPGGQVPPAYFIAKLCRQSTKRSFKIAVPRQAKSAATLICCGADQIHMGSLSELGPIDPQFVKGYGPGQVFIPALALKNSIEHIAHLASNYPAARDMFSDYLSKSLDIEALGYYERVAKSAKDYSVALLRTRRDVSQTEQEMDLIAWKLVYKYTDHGYVIDSDTASEIFGIDVIKRDSPEYSVANNLYPSLELMEWAIDRRFDRTMTFVGSGDACWTSQKPPPV